MKEKIKKLSWPLFAPIAFILWTIDYYFIYFGLSFFFYKLTTSNGIIKIIILILSIPIIFVVIKIFYNTTFLTAFLVTKNKIVYFLFATLYSLNRIMSVFQYCSLKPLKIPNSIIIEIPCYVNLLITFSQIIIIFSLGFIFIVVTRENRNDHINGQIK